MTAMRLPVRFNARVRWLGELHLAEGFHTELQMAKQVICGGEFKVRSGGSISPEPAPGWPVVQFGFDLLYAENLRVTQRIIALADGERPEYSFNSSPCDLVLFLDDTSNEPVIVSRRGKGFAVLFNREACVHK